MPCYLLRHGFPCGVIELLAEAWLWFSGTAFESSETSYLEVAVGACSHHKELCPTERKTLSVEFYQPGLLLQILPQRLPLFLFSVLIS